MNLDHVPTINNDKTTINLDCEVKYSEAELSKWKNSFTSNNNIDYTLYRIVIY